MKLLKIKLNLILKIFIKFSFVIFFAKSLIANEIIIEIEGNNFTDDNVIFSLIENLPTDISEEYSNYILKVLDRSELFEDVSVSIDENKYIIFISEFSNINQIYFINNERLKDEELLELSIEFNLINSNPVVVNEFIDEINKIYQSFGYNNVQISYKEKKFDDSNTSDIFFEINEGDITKIKNIYFEGNELVDNQILKSIIKSKTKTLINIFANNNFKDFVVQNDVRLISNFYKNKGFIDIDINYQIEYLDTNKVNIYFFINEGPVYKYSSIDYLDNDNLISKEIDVLISQKLNNYLQKNINYSLTEIRELKEEISDLIINSGIEFFEISSLEKNIDTNIDILFNIYSVEPNYVNLINIEGNSRTYDRVIRRELNISEGDPIYKRQLENIKNELDSLNLFKSVEVTEKELRNNLVDIEINVEETQTGTINAGLSLGSLDGYALIAGLSENNFYGTGRSLNAIVNTSENKTQYTFETTDRLILENKIDFTFKADYKEQDFSKSSSYNLDTFSTGIGFGYDLNKNLRHIISLDYLIKNYSITNSSTVAKAINNSSGENVSFLLINNLKYNTLNRGFLAKDGQLLNFTNFIETPTSSSNGYIKNTATFKNYKSFNKNIFSAQLRIGNIISLNNNDILSDDKFSLGGRWLRGFDSFGAGPRNSRTSYVGGNNLVVTKFDYSREILNNSDFPIFLNLFNDYGLLWENKTKPTNSDDSLRSSVGFGIKYYSPIGPIGFTWGFPLMDEEYDIKRMFLFSVGNID